MGRCSSDHYKLLAVSLAFRLYLVSASAFVLMGELLCEKERPNPAG